MPEIKEIRLILGDQLNRQHSWFKELDDSVLYVLMEIMPESEYVTHHIQKIVGIFHGMRTMADWLKESGHQVRYFNISDKNNQHSFRANLKSIIEETDAESLTYQEPDEWRLQELFEKELNDLGVKVNIASSEHFLLERDELVTFMSKKSYVMEPFYRKLRKKFDVLMDGDEPVTGQWNYDQSNRKKLPKDVAPPEPLEFSHDVSDILEEIRHAGLNYIGEITAERSPWPKDREEAILVLDYFIKNLLPQFGDYQDALTDRGWSLFHSRLSFALNVKMISPLEVIKAVEKEWYENDAIDISQAEGFIRQVLGWREFMRAVYWLEMPEFKVKNFFEADRKLPDYFWSGDTKMKCVSHAVSQSLVHAYAHHIQRLMVTGNFAMLCGIDPDQIDQWYLGIYIDAFEWVEITNTRGMSQYADGGIVGTKPYAGSASYIHKMSDYCKDCFYNHKPRHGEKACPFNSLYWDFLNRNREKLEGNHRMTMMYRILDKMDAEEKSKTFEQAALYLDNLEIL